MVFTIHTYLCVSTNEKGDSPAAGIGKYDMSKKIIAIEQSDGPFQKSFQKMLSLVPDRDRRDVKLQRLIAFRLKIDGEGPTAGYLSHKIREVVQCGYRGSLYNFLKDDLKEKECGLNGNSTDPPDVA